MNVIQIIGKSTGVMPPKVNRRMPIPFAQSLQRPLFMQPSMDYEKATNISGR